MTSQQQRCKKIFIIFFIIFFIIYLFRHQKQRVKYLKHLYIFLINYSYFEFSLNAIEDEQQCKMIQ